MVAQAGSEKLVLINVEETLAGLRRTALVDHAFWATSSASGQVAALLQDYKSVAQKLSSMMKYVLLENASFKNHAKEPVGASELKVWVEKLPADLRGWLPTTLAEKVQARFLHVCQSQLSAQCTAGIAGIASVAQDCAVKGGSQGFTQERAQKLLAHIPKTHPLQPLVASFAEAGGLLVVCKGRVGVASNSESW